MAKARLKALLGRKHRDERGATLVITAVAMTAILGAGAMGVDLGFSVWGNRLAQSMADTAALDVVQNILTADSMSTDAQVQSYLQDLLKGVDKDNGSDAGLSVTPGWWLNGVFSASTASNSCAGTIFTTSPPPCNAVEVSATQTVPQPFHGGFNTLTGHGGQNGGGGPPPPPPPGAIAAYTPEAGFSIGSYLATISTQQCAVLNVLLGTLGTLGTPCTSANVTILGYQGLANTYVTVNDLITASGGLLTTSNVMTASLPALDWQRIWTNAVGNQVAQTNCASSPLLCNAQTALSGLGFGTQLSGYASLCQMVSINGSTCSTLPTSALSANLNALQTLTTEAEVANGTNALDVTSALTLPDVASATLHLSLVQLPQDGGPGPVGTYTSAAQCQAPAGFTSTCAHTAQLSSDLQLTLTPIVGLPTQVLDIPLSGAMGVATLLEVNCDNNVMQTVKINVATTVASGSVSLNGGNIGTASVTGARGSGTYNAVPPNSSTIGATNDPNPHNFGTTTPTISFTPISGLGALNPVVSTALSAADGALGLVLQTAGASVGGAQVAATSATCDVPSIVQ